MNCLLYSALTPAEQAEYIGKLVIAVQNSDYLFERGKCLIEDATIVGIYDTTKPYADAAALADLDAPIDNGISSQQTQ